MGAYGYKGMHTRTPDTTKHSQAIQLNGHSVFTMLTHTLHAVHAKQPKQTYTTFMQCHNAHTMHIVVSMTILI